MRCSLLGRPFRCGLPCLATAGSFRTLRGAGEAARLAGTLLAAALLAGAAVPALALEDPFLRWEFVDRRIDSTLRDFPADRLWESPDTNLVQTIVVALDTDEGAASARAVVLAEEDGVATDDPLLVGGELRVGRRFARGLGLGLGVQAIGENQAPVDDLFLTEAQLSWQGERHRWSLGRSRLRWGAGPSGSLLIGATAPPRWQLRWRTERALAIPTFGWDALHGRTWTGSFFLAYLDDDERTIADPLLLGHRLSLQPVSWFEITGTRTILFGGAGRTGRLDLEGILDILLVQNENRRGARPPSDSDQRASWEFRLRPPVERFAHAWEGLELFWEYGGEDVNDPPFPSAAAHHWGALTRVSAWTFVFEGVETVTGRNRWYDHVVYGREAYAYRGLLLGHPIGGDGRLWEGSVYTPPGRLRVRGAVRVEEFGFYRPPRERRSTVEMAARVSPSPGLAVEAVLARTWREDGPAPRAPGWARHRGEFRLTWTPGNWGCETFGSRSR